MARPIPKSHRFLSLTNPSRAINRLPLQLVAPRRRFHASSPRRIDIPQFSALDAITYIPRHAMEGLHDLGLSWAVVIPIAALTVRAGIHFFLTVPALQASQRGRDLAPIIRANRHVIMSYYGFLQGPQVIKTEEKKLRVRWRAEIWRRFLPLVQLPVFLTLIEALRSLMGLKQGLLGWIFGSKEVGTKEALSTTQSEALALNSTAFDDVAQPPALDAVVAQVPEVSDVVAVSSWTVEGLPWCPDFTAVDPYFILPVAAPALLWLNAWYSYSNVDIDRLGRTAQIARRFLLLLPVYMGVFITVHIPAGILWYWTCSAGLARLTSMMINRQYPARWPVSKDFKLAERPIGRIKKIPDFENFKEAVSVAKTGRSTNAGP